MSSKGKLGLNLFEKNLKRHPSVKGLFDDQGNKKLASNSKNEFLVLGGAYSVDKFYRLSMGYKWFSDEQMTIEERENFLNNIPKHFIFFLFAGIPSSLFL